MSNEETDHSCAVPVPTGVEPLGSSGIGLTAVATSENEKGTGQSLDITTTDNSSDVVLVDYEANDPENPLNCVFATMTITPTAPQILQEFHSTSSLDQTLLVTILELGEGCGPFFIAPLSERFGRLPVFHVGNLLALLCLIACALSVNIPMVIAFRFLTGMFLSILTLGPAIVGDLFETDSTGLTMALAMGLQMLADFISPVAGSYIASDLGWRWAIWLAAIVLGFFGLFLLLVLRETYSVLILKRKAERLQRESTDGKQYRSKHQAHVDASTILESVTKPIYLLLQSPILTLTTSYMAIKYALVALFLSTITEVMESMYPDVFTTASVGLTFLSFAIGNTIALVFYSLTSDRFIMREKRRKGDAYKPETRLVHLFYAALILPVGFLIYGWTLQYHAHYIVPLVGTTVAGFSMTLSTLPIETYVVDVYKIHAASAIAAGVIFRATAGAFLPLIGFPLYHSIGLGWGNTVLALLAAVFVLPLGMLLRYGDWWRSRERFGSTGR
ncbi:hypothetical protein AMS68_000688 [Peltaster fructicola]|uniref:Major facilitator superfamily (MFS) profile domain-containing protein n=1 Tax=Peltaster fructicola TaxID=286661 RepID=A0A6H0XKL1_9PEZI|nr:hypothetical protein AMS68_000688 [Peltaster fructicola]